MTKTHALLRLLEHGALLRSEINDITGWHRPTLATLLHTLRSEGQIRRYREDGAHEFGYQLVTTVFELPAERPVLRGYALNVRKARIRAMRGAQ